MLQTPSCSTGSFRLSLTRTWRGSAPPGRAVTDFLDSRDECYFRVLAVADVGGDFPAAWSRKQQVTREEAGAVSIVRLVRFKPERWRIGVDSTAGDVNFASNAPRPSELHSQRPFFRLKSGSARFEHNRSVWPQSERANGQQRVSVTSFVSFR